MVDVLTSIEINAPLRSVADYASNPDNAPNWYVNIRSVEWKTQKPLHVGSRIAFVTKFLGKELAYTYEVTELSDHKLVMKTGEGAFPMETTYMFEATHSNGTTMTLRNKGEPTGFSKFFTPFISFMIKRANNKDLKTLKSILEDSIE